MAGKKKDKGDGLIDGCLDVAIFGGLSELFGCLIPIMLGMSLTVLGLLLVL